MIVFNANDGEIKITMPDGSYAKVPAAGILFAENDITDALIDLGATLEHSFSTSSGVDFCEEEGFEPGEARVIIERAIEDVHKTLEVI